MRIYGVDFTCAPRKAKPITVASGRLKRDRLTVEEIEKLEDFAAFEAFLARPGPWLGGFDFPFSLPRELVRDLSWPEDWPGLVAHCARMTRMELRAALDAYRSTRQPGNKYVHRATDHPAGSSSPMKLVNPPVALMFHEGARRVLASGVYVPALSKGDSMRVALEAYPGLLARKQLGIRDSYKSDTRREHTPARRAARKKIVQALKSGYPLNVRVTLDPRLEKEVLADGSGDLLDAVICAVQAAWGWNRRESNFGLPAHAHPAEGWIVSS
ncbi:MAG TPA: DUF429 domain-containing protein [Burkholderiales bacterium]